MEEQIKGFSSFIKGYFSKRFLILIIVPVMIGVFILFIGISWSQFENYDWTLYEISELGTMIENPNGWGYWAVGMIWVGLCMIPLIPYLYHHLIIYNQKLAKIGSLCLVISTIGNLGLGILPQNIGLDDVHEMNGGLALGGLYFAMFFFGFIVLRNNTYPRWQKILFTTMGWWPVIGLIITMSIRIALGNFGMKCTTGFCPWYLLFDTWEWFLLIGVFVELFVLLFITPELSKKL